MSYTPRTVSQSRSSEAYIDFRIPTNSTVIKGTAGALTISSNAAGTGTILSQETLPDDVYKVVFTVAANATASNAFVGIGPNSTIVGETVIVLAAQVEEAAFGSSYIKTTGSTASRSADVASIDVDQFGYNQSEGTVFVDFDMKYEESGSAYPRVVEIASESSIADRIKIMFAEPTGNLLGQSFVNFSVQGNCNLGS